MWTVRSNRVYDTILELVSNRNIFLLISPKYLLRILWNFVHSLCKKIFPIISNSHCRIIQSSDGDLGVPLIFFSNISSAHYQVLGVPNVCENQFKKSRKKIGKFYNKLLLSSNLLFKSRTLHLRNKLLCITK